MYCNCEYLEMLDDSQRAAVEYIDGPSLIIAGAGAGKTRTLTAKVAYLIDNGIMPWNILALTFTNKAAREMRDRISSIVGYDTAKRLQMGTFHSVFSRILRSEADVIGYPPHFTIYDRNDSASLIKSIVKELALDEKKYKAGTVLSRISWAKNRLLLPDSYATDPECLKTDSRDNIPAVRDIYLKYQQRLRASGVMDFDDLLIQMYLLLERNEAIRRKYVERFEFVLVDEYQDTNFTQARILIMLTRERKRICVVGDDAQSIYAFRGADIGNILNFTQIFPEAKLFKLERNYRSTSCIVEAANSVIAHNKERIPKKVYSLSGRGEGINVKETFSDLEEADVVTRQILKLHTSKHVEYRDTAVLYRTNAQSRVIEESLRKNDIPYRIIGGLSFYERKEVKDVIAYFRLTVNPDDEEAFRRIINYPTRGIGSTTLTKIIVAATGRNISLWRAINELTATELNVSNATKSKLAAFAQMIKEFICEVGTADAYTLGKHIIEKSGITKEIDGDTSIENLTRRENLQELLNAMNTFVANTLESEGTTTHATLDRYLAEVSLLTEADTNTDTSDGVTLMTIHSAKGLEFEAVFIVGVEDEIFPGQAAKHSQRDMEEERRLFYVALTRAKTYCFLSYAHSRFRYGVTKYSEASCFLEEIDKSCLNIKKQTAKYRLLPKKTSLFGSSSYDKSTYGKRKFDSLFETTDKAAIKRREKTVTSGFETYTPNKQSLANDIIDDIPCLLQTAHTKSGEILHVGQTVEHERFGHGVVESLTDMGDTAKAHIKFENSGEKDLLLKFAPLKIVGSQNYPT